MSYGDNKFKYDQAKRDASVGIRPDIGGLNHRQIDEVQRIYAQKEKARKAFLEMANKPTSYHNHQPPLSGNGPLYAGIAFFITIIALFFVFKKMNSEPNKSDLGGPNPRSKTNVVIAGMVLVYSSIKDTTYAGEFKNGIPLDSFENFIIKSNISTAPRKKNKYGIEMVYLDSIPEYWVDSRTNKQKINKGWVPYEHMTLNNRWNIDISQYRIYRCKNFNEIEMCNPNFDRTKYY